MPENLKIAIVGAGTLRGKDLNETFAESPFANADFVLLDDEAQTGQLESIGDEVTFIQRIEPGAFRGVDLVFFAGDPETTRRHWQSAHKMGCSILDISGALEGQPNVLVRAPWLQLTPETALPRLDTPAVVPAHPVAVALALLLQRASRAAATRLATATVLEPASEYGRGATDELHQQTVNLLNFQGLPTEYYDVQAAFNLLPSLGAEARIHLGASEATIRRHLDLLTGAAKLPRLDVQLIHAPVFHGHGISLYLRLSESILLEDLEQALTGEYVRVISATASSETQEVPSNLSSAGEPNILVRARTAAGDDAASDGFWIWMAFDNLKMNSLNAIACGIEVTQLRPRGEVQ